MNATAAAAIDTNPVAKLVDVLNGLLESGAHGDPKEGQSERGEDFHSMSYETKVRSIVR